MRRIVAATALLLVAGCSGGSTAGPDPSGTSSGPAAAPDNHVCRALTADAISSDSDDTPAVDCASAHTAETFYVGEFSSALKDADPTDTTLGAEVFDACEKRYMKFTGADASLALRTVLDWAWWRPTDDEWKAGARWFRCDVVGGTEDSADLIALPTTAKGVLLGKPSDAVMGCVVADTVDGSPRVTCDQPHLWRAVTTIALGRDHDTYPGDRLSEVRSRDYCSKSVGAWLDYPIRYEYAYTWYGKAEWEAGNRRAVCWAKTDQ